MHALLIYILIRLDEGETDYNNYDSLLLATVAVGLALSLSLSRPLLLSCYQTLALLTYYR